MKMSQQAGFSTFSTTKESEIRYEIKKGTEESRWSRACSLSIFTILEIEEMVPR